jgi:coenzyme F420-0:L-glutamate ligase
MQIIPVRTRLFRQDESVADFVREHVTDLRPDDILVITSKIVALSQGRVLESGFDKRATIRAEADEVRESPWCFLTRRGSDWCANAGVDESNADGKLILLPKDPAGAARALRVSLERIYGFAPTLILTDTRIVPLRQGTMGMALAWAGIKPIKDYVGSPDLYGRHLKMTKANIVHALATAAVLVMGEGAESVPIVIIRDADVERDPDASGEVSDLAILPREDVYRVVFE